MHSVTERAHTISERVNLSQQQNQNNEEDIDYNISCLFEPTIENFAASIVAEQNHPLQMQATTNPANTTTEGYSRLFMSSVGTLGSYLGWAGGKVKSAAKSVTPHLASWATKGSKKNRNNEIRNLVFQLDGLTGSKHSSHIILTASPHITAFVLSILKDWPLVSWVATEGDIKTIIDATLLQVAVNLLDYNRQHPMPVQENSPAHPTVNVFLQILNGAINDFSAIDATLNTLLPLMEGQPPGVKVSNCQATLRPLLQKLVEMAFPHGQTDIKAPYPVNHVIWKGLQCVLLDVNTRPYFISKLISLENIASLYDKAIKFYIEFKQPLARGEECRERISTMTGGAELVGVIHRTCTNVLPTNIGNWIASGNDFLAEKIVLLAVGKDEENAQARTWLQTWLGARIKEYGASERVEGYALHSFLGKYLEGLIYTTIIRMTENSTQTNDIAPLLLSKILTGPSQQLHGSHVRIHQLMHEIQQLKLSPSISLAWKRALQGAETELNLLFVSISREFFAGIGIDKAADLPLPSVLQGITFDYLELFGPKILFEIYSSVDKNLELIKPKKLSETQNQLLRGRAELEAIATSFWQQQSSTIKGVIVNCKSEIAEIFVDQIGNFTNVSLGADGIKVCEQIIEHVASTHDDDVKRVVDFAECQLQEIFIQIAGQLALTSPLASDFRKTGNTKDILTDTLLHVLCMGSAHLFEMEAPFRRKIAELDALEDELETAESEIRNDVDELSTAIKHKESEVYALFIPLASNIIQATGLDSNPWAKVLKEKALPVVLAHLYKDVVIEKPLPEALRQRLSEIDSQGTGKEISNQVAQLLNERLKEIVSESAPTVLNWLSEQVFTKPLSSEESTWLEQSINAVLCDNSYGVSQTWKFIQEYSSKIINNVFTHLALSQRAGINAGSDNLLSLALMNGVRLISRELGRQAGGEDLDTRLFNQLLVYDQMEDGPVKKAHYTQLLAQLVPAAEVLLQSAGLQNEGNLNVPSFLRKPVWKLLKTRLLPAILLTIYQDLACHTSRHPAAEAMDGHGELEDTVNDIFDEFFPKLLAFLDNPDLDIAGELDYLLTESGLTAIPKSWVQTALERIAVSGNDRSVTRTWQLISSTIAGRAFDAATHLAVANAEAPSRNILTNIIVNGLELLQRNLNGEGVTLQLQDAVKDYDRYLLLQKALLSARQVMTSKPKRTKPLSIDRLRRYTEETLSSCGITAEQKSQLACHAREFLLITATQESEVDVIQALLFGAAQTSTTSIAEQLNSKIARAVNESRDLLKNTFGGFANDIMENCGFGEDKGLGLPGCGKLYNLSAIRNELIPAILLRLYKDITEPQRHGSALQEKIKQLILPLDSKKSEGEEVEKYLKDTFCVISQDVVKYTRDYLAANSHSISEFLPEELQGIEVAAGICVQELSVSDHPAVLEALGTASKLIETAALKIFLHLAETTDTIFPSARHESPQKMIAANLMIRMIGVLSRHGTAIRVHLNDLSSQRLSPGELASRTHEIFKPISQELLEISLPNRENDLPLPVVARSGVFTIIKDSIFPRVLEKMYLDIWGWNAEEDSAKIRLREQFGTSHPSEFLHVVARLGADKVDQYLRAQSDDVADLVFDTLKKYLRSTGETGGAIVDYLESNRKTIKGFLEENIHKGFTSQDPNLEAMWSVVHKYIENVIVRMIANVFGHVSGLEGGKSDYLIQSTLNILELCIQHFGRINQVSNAHKAKHAFDVKPEEMLVGYNQEIDAKLQSSPDYIQARTNLYRAEDALRQANFRSDRPAKAKAVEEARSNLEEIRRNELLRTLLHDFLEMAGFDSADSMPYPGLFKDTVWEASHEKLMPLIADAFFELLTDPSTINRISTSFIETINGVLNSLPDAEPVETDNENDETQRRLNEACGLLVRQFIDLMPQDITGRVLHIDRIKNLTARTVGKAVREELSKWTIIKLADLMMFSTLPNILPGEWVGQQNEERFSPRKVVDGHITAEPAPLRFNLPITAQEKKRAGDSVNKQNRVVEANLRRLMSKTIDDQVRGVIRNFILTWWAKFQAAFDSIIEKRTGSRGAAFKEMADFACRKIFFDMIGAAITLVAYPVYKAICYLVEFYYNQKAKDIIQNLHLDINADFMRKLSLEIMHNLNMHRKEQRV